MPIIDISNLPPAPSRKMAPGDFVAAADAHVASLTKMVGQLNTAFDQIEQAEANAEADAQATAADRIAGAEARAAAQLSAELAAGYAGAVVWSAVAVYAADAVVFSPSNRMLYRRKAAGSSGTDPAGDAANWAPVTLAVGGNAVWHAGNLNPANYLPLAGGVMTGPFTSRGMVIGPGWGGAGGGTNGAGARLGQFDRQAGCAVLQLGGADNAQSFEVIDRNWTTQILHASMSAFNYKGQAVWHTGNLNMSGIMGNRGETNEDAALDNGFYRIPMPGYSRGLLSFNTGGSTGTIQVMAEYQGRIWWRNKTDNANWTGWREFYHTGNFNPGAYATLKGNVTFNECYADSWFRSHEATGWYNQTYGGGIYMKDHSWVRTYNNKGLLIESNIGSYGCLQLHGPDAETSMHFRALGQAQDVGWTTGRYPDRFFWYGHGAQRMGLYNDGTLGVAGRIYGNDVNRAGLGLGRITVSNGGPSGGSEGDWWVTY